MFSQREQPADIEEFALPVDDPINVATLLRAAGVVDSAKEARRLLAQGAISTDERRVTEEWIARDLLADRVLKIGKRRYLRLVAS